MKGSSLSKDIYLHLIRHYLFPRDGWSLARTCHDLWNVFRPPVLRAMGVGIPWRRAEKITRTRKKDGPMRLRFWRVRGGDEYVQCEKCLDHVKKEKKANHDKRNCLGSPWEECDYCGMRGHMEMNCIFWMTKCNECDVEGPSNLVGKEFPGATVRDAEGVLGYTSGCFRCGIIRFVWKSWDPPLLPWSATDDIHIDWTSFCLPREQTIEVQHISPPW
jgi:hypothetical protein